MFNICQANFKSAHLLNKMALIQFHSNRTVSIKRKYLKQYSQGVFEKTLIENPKVTPFRGISQTI